ncbi:MAG: hypothetical protein GXO97_09000 [Nitrospirae bacterium]|nr:hypothetical protein [Nitrospirota bacterium]
MEVGRLFKESFFILKDNTMIMFPPILAFFLTNLLLILVLGNMVSEGVEQRKLSVSMILLVTLIGFGIQSLSHAITVVMAQQALSEKRCSLKYGFNESMKKIGPVFSAGILIGILFTIGMMLFVIPGLVVLYVFMFTVVVIILRNLHTLEAMKKSYQIIRANITDTLFLFLSLLGSFLIIWIVGRIFLRVPLFGQIINALLMGGLFAFLAVVLVKSFRVLESN